MVECRVGSLIWEVASEAEFVSRFDLVPLMAPNPEYTSASNPDQDRRFEQERKVGVSPTLEN